MAENLNQRLLNQYHENKAVYDDIEDQLDTIYDTIMHDSETVAKTLLYLGDVFAIVSVQTHVSAHEQAFTRVVGLNTREEIVEVLRTVRGPNNQPVMYHNYKSDYLMDALTSVDYDRQLELFRARKFDELHRFKVDNVKGLRMAKASFALAMCGVTDRMCVDSNVARLFGYDWDDVPDTVVVERYHAFCDELVAKAPALARRTNRFLFQWVAFDLARDVGITPHDVWFLQAEEVVDQPLLETL